MRLLLCLFICLHFTAGCFRSQSASTTSISISCKGKCHQNYQKGLPCQCTRNCKQQNTCCKDYDDTCKVATKNDIIQLTEELYNLDVNNVGRFINYETKLPGPLFVNVNQKALQGPTISTFIPLINNFFSSTKRKEINTDQEMEEKNRFLNAILKTNVMKKTEEFLTRFNLLDVSLKNKIDSLFFKNYPRDRSTLGSSGFEHTFVGEIDDDIVKGYHNWISYYIDEKNGTLRYTSFFREKKLDENTNLISIGFEWHGKEKYRTSFWIGTSPEFEISVYLVCFLVYPNSHCPVSTNGHKYNIQSWEKKYKDEILIGSVFPKI